MISDVCHEKNYYLGMLIYHSFQILLLLPKFQVTAFVTMDEGTSSYHNDPYIDFMSKTSKKGILCIQIYTSNFHATVFVMLK